MGTVLNRTRLSILYRDITVAQIAKSFLCLFCTSGFNCTFHSVLGTDGKNLLQFLGQSNMSNAAANALMMQRLLGTGYELHPLGSRKDEDPFSQIKVGSTFSQIKFGLWMKIHFLRIKLIHSRIKIHYSN